MIFGSVQVDDDAVITHRDSYLLPSLSVVSVRRPFLGAAIILGGAFLGFGVVFADLLHMSEIAWISGISTLTVIIGAQAGQLKLLSRDLRGSELSDVVWGRYSSLNEVRSKIVRNLGASRPGDNT